MCALACCWSLFTVDSTAIAQLPTIKTTKTLNSATCTAVWLSACVCVCVRERECECAQFLWVFVGDAALLLLRFTLNLIVCVCVLRSSAVAVLLSAVFLLLFIWMATLGAHLQRTALPLDAFALDESAALPQPTTERSCQLLHRCCAASAVVVVVVVSHQRYTVKASATTTTG